MFVFFCLFVLKDVLEGKRRQKTWSFALSLGLFGMQPVFDRGYTYDVKSVFLCFVNSHKAIYNCLLLSSCFPFKAYLISSFDLIPVAA